MICRARSRSASYQYGLMLSASTSMPCSSIARSRVATSVAMSRSGRSVGPASFRLISASASGTAQCACTSTVLTRLPLTTTSRRRALGPRGRSGHEVAADERDAGERAGGGPEELPARGHGAKISTFTGVQW